MVETPKSAARRTTRNSNNKRKRVSIVDDDDDDYDDGAGPSRPTRSCRLRRKVNYADEDTDLDIPSPQKSESSFEPSSPKLVELTNARNSDDMFTVDDSDDDDDDDDDDFVSED